MTSASLARRIEATDTRALLPSAITSMPSGVQALAAELPITPSAPFPISSQQTGRRPAGNVSRVASWATAVSAAVFVMTAGLAFDLFVLWIASGRMIERLPF